MKVILNDRILSSGYETSTFKELMQPGKNYSVMIAEHRKTNPRFGYYLIDIGIPQGDTYISDHEVDRGDFVRTFLDPKLEKDYSQGTYIWIEQDKADALPLNNKEAARLLQSTEVGDVFL